MFIPGPRRLLTICPNYGAYSSQYDMCHLTGCGFRSLESYTGYSPFHIDHNAPPLIKKIGKTIDTMKSAKLIVLRENYLCKTSIRQQGEVVAVDSCFAIIVARQDSASTERTSYIGRVLNKTQTLPYKRHIAFKI